MPLSRSGVAFPLSAAKRGIWHAEHLLDTASPFHHLREYSSVHGRIHVRVVEADGAPRRHVVAADWTVPFIDQADGRSMAVVDRDLSPAWEARCRGDARGWGSSEVQYADYTLWQHVAG